MFDLHYTGLLWHGFTGPAMFLYALTLQKATAITHAIHGNFSGTKQQEIVIARSKVLELLRPDTNTGKIVPVLAVEVFGVIRSLVAFRLTGGSKGQSSMLALYMRKSPDCSLEE